MNEAISEDTINIINAIGTSMDSISIQTGAIGNRSGVNAEAFEAVSLLYRAGFIKVPKGETTFIKQFTCAVMLANDAFNQYTPIMDFEEMRLNISLSIDDA